MIHKFINYMYNQVSSVNKTEHIKFKILDLTIKSKNCMDICNRHLVCNKVRQATPAAVASTVYSSCTTWGHWVTLNTNTATAEIHNRGPT